MKTVYYCSESEPLSDLNRCYLQMKEKLVALFQKNTKYQLCRLEKPEIYKHPVAFRFLDGFRPDALHLILRQPNRIRLLKYARNILVLPETLSEAELAQRPAPPFGNLNRMVSLVDGIWTTRQENLACIKGEQIPPVEYFKDEFVLFEKIAASA